MEWSNWLTERGVEIKGAAFGSLLLCSVSIRYSAYLYAGFLSQIGLPSVEKSTAEHLKQAEADISQQHSGASFHFPADYTAFAQQIGGGTPA